jgi:Reticulon.
MSEEEVGTAPEQVEEPAPVEEEKKEEEPAAEEPKEEPKKEAAACSGECPCEMLCKPFQESKFFEDMKKVFMWDDLITSLAVFCAVNVFFVLLLCYDFTVLGLICWIAFFGTLAGLCVDIQRVIAHFQEKPEPESMFDKMEFIKKFEIPEDPIKGFFELATSVIVAFLNVCKNAILVKSVVFSISMLVGFLVLIYLAGKWGICGMLYAAILFCFIWFRLYRDHKEGVDNLFAKIKEQVNNLIQKAKEAINKPKAQ